jgi:hypothetical protein
MRTCIKNSWESKQVGKDIGSYVVQWAKKCKFEKFRVFFNGTEVTPHQLRKIRPDEKIRKDDYIEIQPIYKPYRTF